MVAHPRGVEAQHGHLRLRDLRGVVDDLQGQRRQGAEADPAVQAHSLAELVQVGQGGRSFVALESFMNFGLGENMRGEGR